MFLSFFFQAEDGIRDGHVTGVQTCALPIWSGRLRRIPQQGASRRSRARRGRRLRVGGQRSQDLAREIGRASCRERVESSGVAGSLQKKIEDEGQGAAGIESQ